MEIVRGWMVREARAEVEEARGDLRAEGTAGTVVGRAPPRREER